MQRVQGAVARTRTKPDFLSGGQWAVNGVQLRIPKFAASTSISFTASRSRPANWLSPTFGGFGDELAAKEFHNSKLGLPVLRGGAQITDDMIEQVIANHTMQDPTSALRQASDSSRWESIKGKSATWSFANGFQLGGQAGETSARRIVCKSCGPVSFSDSGDLETPRGVDGRVASLLLRHRRRP